MRIFGLVLAVLRGTEFLLVGLLFLALDGILLVDRREEQIERFADKTFTTGSRCGDTGEERQGLFLFIQILEADACGECAENRQTCNDHRRTIVSRQTTANKTQQAW